ncbi:SEC-C metal-binding domain-containing protein [Providencia sp. Me31A]
MGIEPTIFMENGTAINKKMMTTLTRNQQCPCGSGVRYKWCCGKLK